jgi:glutamate-1-semialdehyde 2,1-aminomutase
VAGSVSSGQRAADGGRRTARSAELYDRAQQLLPGGVNSPVRAFKAVGGGPIFIRRGEGCWVEDVDGNRYVDCLGSWGPLILGHAYPAVVEAVRAAAADGTSFGAPTEREVELAELIVEAFPSVEMVRLVNSGTEACMSAIRVARAHTGRDKIVKFDGCYHGHADGLLVSAGSGALTLGAPDSPGVPAVTTRETISARYNDLGSVGEAFERFGGEIAAVIVEPIAANMGVVPPAPGFLEGLRALSRDHDALLIFDEVVSGFRVAYGGAQELYGVHPDLTCMGKILGGGLPLGGYGGRRDIMEQVSPAGAVYQAGTLSGNPLATAAGLAMLRALKELDPYAELERKSATLEAGLADAAEVAGARVTISRVGSMLTAFFTDAPVIDYDSAKRSDTSAFARFFSRMLERGVYLAPSQFEAAFVSLAHGPDEVRATVEAAGRAFAAL